MDLAEELGRRSSKPSYLSHGGLQPRDVVSMSADDGNSAVDVLSFDDITYYVGKGTRVSSEVVNLCGHKYCISDSKIYYVPDTTKSGMTCNSFTFKFKGQSIKVVSQNGIPKEKKLYKVHVGDHMYVVFNLIQGWGVFPILDVPEDMLAADLSDCAVYYTRNELNDKGLRQLNNLKGISIPAKEEHVHAQDVTQSIYKESKGSPSSGHANNLFSYERAVGWTPKENIVSCLDISTNVQRARKLQEQRLTLKLQEHQLELERKRKEQELLERKKKEEEEKQKKLVKIISLEAGQKEVFRVEYQDPLGRFAEEFVLWAQELAEIGQESWSRDQFKLVYIYCTWFDMEFEDIDTMVAKVLDKLDSGRVTHIPMVMNLNDVSNNVRDMGKSQGSL